MAITKTEVEARLDAGNDFGDRAMGMFGPYEEMTVYLPGKQIPDKKAMIARTQEHLAKGTPVICEAAFSNYSNYCAVDILRKTETGYDFYQVKNAPEVYEQFHPGRRLPVLHHYSLRVKIGRIFVVVHGPDEEYPFVPVEVTHQAKGYYSWINDNIWDLNRMQKEAEEVKVESGNQCCNPYGCWYYGYCHGIEKQNLI